MAKRRVWRWAVPIGLAVAVVALAAADGSQRGPVEGYGTGLHGPTRMPRFMLTVGSMQDSGARGGPWLRVNAIAKNGQEQLVDSVRSPSPSAGEAQEIMAGPGGMFVVAASRAKPCESRLYRFRLTGAGRATGITPVKGGRTPALVAGLAISADGRRIAYATAPCADVPSTPSRSAPQPASPPSATLTVLDVATGHRRTWTTGGTSITGEIIWARDGRTLGYTVADVIHRTPTSPPTSPPLSPGGIEGLSGDTVGHVTVRALDTDAPGGDLLAGRLLFRAPDDSGAVTSAIMNPDGRTGHGIMRKGRPPGTILFSFAEGRPMRVTKIIPSEPGTITGIGFSANYGPRYSCLSGVDAFGRVIEGNFGAGSHAFGRCGTAMAY